MIATETFLFLHLHKSGGTFINHAILNFMPAAKRLGYHLPYAYLPQGYDHLPVVGVIRNPWDYYISFYHFQNNSAHPNYVFRAFSENGTCNIKQTLKNMALPQDKHFEIMKRRAPLEFTNKGVNLTKNCVDQLQEMSGGWYTRLFDRMYEGTEPHFMFVENLRDDFLFVIDLYGEKTSSEFDDYVLSSKKKNTSEHDHYSTYYDDELKDLISEVDSSLIERFDYSFEYN